MARPPSMTDNDNVKRIACFITGNLTRGTASVNGSPKTMRGSALGRSAAAAAKEQRQSAGAEEGERSGLRNGNQEAADLAIGEGGGMNLKIRLAVGHAERQCVERIADRAPAGGDEFRRIGGGGGEVNRLVVRAG